MAPDETHRRIIDGFLRLAEDRGTDAVTTRAVAAEAGVNEVTIFRHFGDKSTLLREAIEHLLAIPPPEPPVPHRPVAGGPGLQRVVGILRRTRDALVLNRTLMQISVVSSMGDPAISDIVRRGPLGVHSRLLAAFVDAGAEVRSGVDVKAAALALQGFAFMSAVWHKRGYIDWDFTYWNSLLEAAARPYFKEEAS